MGDDLASDDSSRTLIKAISNFSGRPRRGEGVDSKVRITRQLQFELRRTEFDATSLNEVSKVRSLFGRREGLVYKR